jgi:hypothetical protein
VSTSPKTARDAVCLTIYNAKPDCQYQWHQSATTHCILLLDFCNGYQEINVMVIESTNQSINLLSYQLGAGNSLDKYYVGKYPIIS